VNLEILVLSFLIIIFSVILHEIAHGLVADKLGDPTARLLGRLTLNPIPHIDPVMTIIFPLITFLATLPTGFPLVFGGAKPVPVDPFNLRDPKKDMAIISLAGPGTNFILALVAAIFAHLVFPDASFFQIYGSGILGAFLALTMTINISLGIFNLIPIPPLDGSKIFASFLPEDLAKTYLSIGSIGILILILLISPISPFPVDSFISSIMIAILRIFGF
jgi:Zn-dependent protease